MALKGSSTVVMGWGVGTLWHILGCFKQQHRAQLSAVGSERAPTLRGTWGAYQTLKCLNVLILRRMGRWREEVRDRWPWGQIPARLLSKPTLRMVCCSSRLLPCVSTA